MNKLLMACLFTVGMISVLFSQTGEDPITDYAGQTTTASTEEICANIPNYFTPDRDGVDDEWCLKSSGADKCILRLWTPGGSHIYWDKAYTVEDNRTVCLWDNGIGNGGTTYPDGTYYYHIRLLDTTTGTERIFEGIVELFGSTRVVEKEQGQ